MPVILRCARSKDANAVRALVHSSYALYLDRMEVAPAPMGADYPDLISKRTVTVAEMDSQMAGILVCYPRGDALHVENVAVDPAFQGQGIGGVLMGHVEEQARSQNLARIELYTHEVMTENIAFYETLGFHIRERGVEDGYARIFFEKSLESI